MVCDDLLNAVNIAVELSEILDGASYWHASPAFRIYTLDHFCHMASFRVVGYWFSYLLWLMMTKDQRGDENKKFHRRFSSSGTIREEPLTPLRKMHMSSVLIVAPHSFKTASQKINN